MPNSRMEMLRTELRKSPRYAFRRSCTAYFDGFPLHGTMFDISQDGCGFRLNFGSMDDLRGGLRTLDIEGLGRFDVKSVWSSGDRRGAQFIHTNESSRMMEVFLKQQFGEKR